MRMAMKWVPVYLTLLLAACGDDGGGAAADAGDDVDAGDGFDAAPANTACGVFYQGSGTDRVGRLVSFNGPDGALLGTDITDVDGRASFDACVPDTQVSLYRDNISGGNAGLPGSLYTVTGVQPGDTLVFGYLGEGSTQTASVNATAAADISGLTNSATYEVQVGPPLTAEAITPGGSAIVDAVSDSYAVGRDGVVRGFGWAFDGDGALVGYSAGSADFAPDTIIDMTLGPWTAVTPPTNVSLEAGVAPAGFQSHYWRLQQMLVGVLYSSNESAGAVPAPFAEIPAFPPALFDSHQVTAGYSTASSFFGSFTEKSEVLTTAGLEPGATHTVDPQAFFLPRLHQPVVLANGGRPTIQWFTDGDVSNADAAGFFFWFGEDGPRASWLVITHRAGDGMLTLPELPDSLADFAPRESEFIDVREGLVFDMDYATYQELITTNADTVLGAASGESLDTPDLDRFLLRVSRWSSCQVAQGGSGGVAGFGVMLALLLVIRRRRRVS